MEAIVIAVAKANATFGRCVTNNDLGRSLALQHQLTIAHGRRLMTDIISLITKQLRNGNRVKIAGLGIFQVRLRSAHLGRHPVTGEVLEIKASKTVYLRAAKKLRQNI
jgi:DNA-binding protein HU-beta